MPQPEMDDYSALAQRVAVSVGDVRACLILSRDGLVLGAYPEDDEMQAKPAWLRFGALGDAERSFVEFPDQIWVFCHRGAYSSFAVAGTSVRPGLLLDMMEQALLAAEEARTKREPLKLPEVNAAPSGKPRTAMHPAEETPVVTAGAQRNWSGGRSASAPGGTADKPEGGDGAAPVAGKSGAATDAKREPAKVSGLSKEPQKLVGSAGGTPDDDDDGAEGEVDRVLLAKEFSGLLQMNGDDDEGTS
ncbi:MAG: hypothetical protein QOG21_317 [Actinomycetota bacterium]|nr:hypothetical protein [Actinomycetota bacterium]